MANTYRYSNLSQKEIMNYYIISEQNEFEFIKHYREKLKLFIEGCMRSVGLWDPTYKAKAVKDFILFTEDIKNYIKDAKPQNIMSKVRFINNISKELFALKVELEGEGWLFFNNEVDNVLKSTEVFLKAITIDELMNDNLLGKCKTHLDQEMTKYLISELENNYLSLIDKNDPKYFDTYLFMGACLKKEEGLIKSVEEIQSSKCKDCKIDDCVLSHCNNLYKIEELESQAKTYRKMAEFCKNKLFMIPTNKKEISITNSKIQDEEFKSIFQDIMNRQDKNDKVDKLLINGTSKFLASIDETAIRKNILLMLDEGGQINYRRSDHIAITIIDALYDFKNVTCEDEIKKVQQWFDKYKTAKESVRQNNKGEIINIKMLFDEYYNQNKLEQ